jgi:pyridoxamine 5'-phosphate oxidase
MSGAKTGSTIVFPSTPGPPIPDPVERLDAARAPENPLRLLQHWLAHAFSIGAAEPIYVTLATASADGAPSSRMVQLVEVDDDALVFSTSFISRKGVEMLATGRAAVSIYRRETARSVNITGTVRIADDTENDRRFDHEGRAVQAARTVCRQGRPLDDEAAQLAEFFALLSADTPIRRPADWKWFRVIPDAITFFEGRPEALNRRLHYALHAGAWSRGAVQA